jgi:hypothetical protein
MAVLASVVIAGAGVGVLLYVRHEAGNSPLAKQVAACDIPAEVLQRLWNGYYPRRSGDVLAAEQPNNLFGTRHSTPYYYTQHIPLVLYGPGYIRKGVQIDRSVTMADIAPTYADLLNFNGLGKRDGTPLTDALLPKNRRNGVPKLIFTLVWDGGGWDDLNYWPKSWPNLKRMMGRGADYTNATDGSSPSITPSIHATLGTGDYPKRHGISDIQIRVKGNIIDGWAGNSPVHLRVKTLADLYDLAHNNKPVIGMEARDKWHLGMIGHGAQIPGADKDVAVLDALGAVHFTTNRRYYQMPKNFNDYPAMQRAVNEVDQRDGKADQKWLGNPLLMTDGRVRYSPAWSIYQTGRVQALLRRYHFGQDSTPDMFFTNYKTTDLAGHEWGMTTKEEEQDLAEQDAQIPILIKTLDQLVGKKNYVFLMTADHGMQPPVTVTHGFAINSPELTSDIERRFDHKTPHVPLVKANRGYQFFLDQNEMKINHVTPSEVAAFIRNYRVKDNLLNPNLPSTYSGSENDRIYKVALTPPALKRALDCAKQKKPGSSASGPQAEGVVSPALKDKRRSLPARSKKSGLPRT